MKRWVTLSGRNQYIESSELTQSQQDAIHAQNYQYSEHRDRCYSLKCNCGSEVWYVEHNGGKVIFDSPLGPPWNKHCCNFSECFQSDVDIKGPAGTEIAFVMGLRDKISDGARNDEDDYSFSVWDVALSSSLNRRLCLRLEASSKLHARDFFFVNTTHPIQVWSKDGRKCKVIASLHRPECIDDHLPKNWLNGI